MPNKMMNITRLVVLGLVMSCLMVRPALAADAAAELETLYDDYFERLVDMHPSWAASLGREDLLDQYGDTLSEEYRETREEMARTALATLAEYDKAELGESERLSYELFHYARQQELDYYGSELSRLWRMMPMDQMGGMHSGYAVQASGDSSIPFRTLKHYEMALERADGFARQMDKAIARMREGIEDGVTIPRLLAEKVLPQVTAHVGVPPRETVFFRPIKDFPESISEADRKRLAAAYEEKIATVIQPAYARLARFLEEEYIPVARESHGLGDLPHGDALYRNAIESSTTTEMSAEEIHAIGLAEVERISAELDSLRQRMGFDGTLAEFLTWSRSNPDQFFDSREDKMQRFEAVRARIDARLPSLFNVMPPVDYEIRRVPDYLEASRAAAYYESPAPDGSRPGVFWVNTYKADEEPAIDVVTLSLHEASPGHHFQISIAQQLDDLPEFRRQTTHTAFVEGWGLYAETLGKEMGLFDDPWQYLGHLSWEIHRANRLVVDTGLHAMGWTRQQGIDWMLAHSAISEQNAIAEVERFMAMPGQALSYKIGQLTIQELRDRAADALGEDFDVRAFHDAILLAGSMPLPMLEDHVSRWIAEHAPEQ